MTAYSIATLPGDGIGVEVIAEAEKVLHAVERRYGHRFALTTDIVGGAAIDRFGTALRPETLAMCRKSDAVLFGAVGGPKWDDVAHERRPERGLLALRKELDLYANLRPAKCFPMLVDASPLKRSIVEGTDLMVIRELTGGLYFGEPRGVERFADGRARAVNTMAYTSREIERIARTGFEVARKRRKRLTSVDKANVLVVSQLWRDVVTRIARDYPDVTLEHVLVDNCAMALVQRPTQFDTIVTENTFGDILSDEAAILAGSMGMLPSASLGGAVGLYEPVHGTAPDIAGRGIANPIAAILSVAMLLRYSLNMEKDADRVERAGQHGDAAERAGGDRRPETRPKPGTGFDKHDVAAQKIGQSLADRQSKAGTAEAPGGGGVGLLKSAEDGCRLLRRHPDSSIEDIELQGRDGVGDMPDDESNASGLGELE